eukprot:IDg2604t1
MATLTALKGKSLAELFFTREEPRGKTWICKCGARRAQKGTGYTNLCSHILSEHAAQLERVDGGPDKTMSIMEHFWPKKATNIYSWLDMTVTMMLPFSFCENPCARRHMKSDAISTNTLMKYLSRVTQAVERKISVLLPDKFALVFDGWTCGSTHYLAIYASYVLPDPPRAQQSLLSFSPMGEEESLNADEHMHFTTFVLFVGCASHRFNLAVQDILSSYEDVLSLVHNLMLKLRNLIAAAKLRNLTHLRPKMRNVTWWSSSYEMLRRYQRLREFLPMLHLDSVDELTPNHRDDVTLVDVRILFDTVVEEYPETSARLKQDAGIVHDFVFESAVYKYGRERLSCGAGAKAQADEWYRFTELVCRHAIHRTDLQYVREVVFEGWICPQ